MVKLSNKICCLRYFFFDDLKKKLYFQDFLFDNLRNTIDKAKTKSYFFLKKKTKQSLSLEVNFEVEPYIFSLTFFVENAGWSNSS